MNQYLPLALGNVFLQNYAGDSGIEHMKLQKLCYYAHGWWLAFHKKSLLIERPQVWKYGPVFKSMYGALAHFGSKPIKTPQSPVPFQPPPLVDDGQVHDLCDWIWNRYSQYSAFTLSDMTHASGTPWREIAEKHNFVVPKDYDIPDEVIASYFKQEAEALNPA